MTLDYNTILNTKHTEFFSSQARELVFYGGANSGKSYSTADKLLLQTILPIHNKKPLNSIVIRKTMPSLKKTCMRILQDRADILHIPFNLHKGDNVATLNNNSKMYFVSIDDYAAISKIKSMTDIDFIWMEEVDEILKDALDQCLLRLRGGKGAFSQIILTFNPIGTTSWVYDRYFAKTNNAQKIKVTVDDNPWAKEEDILQLESLKELNENLYRVYRLGEWGSLESTIYPKYSLVNKIPENIDEVIYGLDFGFNNPTALVKIYICDGIPYVEELLYQSNLTQNDLNVVLKEFQINKDVIYADCAEPARIEELRREGFNVLEADKDVNGGITFCQAMKLNVLDNGENIVKEIQSYSWMKDKNGNYIDKPVKFRDHLMDAMRYALYTHLRHRFDFIKIGPEGFIKPKEYSDFGMKLLKMKKEQHRRYR